MGGGNSAKASSRAPRLRAHAASIASLSNATCSGSRRTKAASSAGGRPSWAASWSTFLAGTRSGYADRMVPARLTVVTLGARDLPRLRDFYTGLGWEPAVVGEDFAAFRMRGALLALYPLESLADDAQAPAAAPASGLRGFSLAINVGSREKVDAILDEARSAGARIAKEAADAEWGGRSGYFADPEDNHWEVAWVPEGGQVARALREAAEW